MDDLGPIPNRTRSKFDLRNVNINDIKGITNERKKKSLNQHFQKINNKNNLEECISEISNRESDNYRNKNGARNDNNLKINISNKNTDPNNLLNKANGTTRKVVGGVLAGVGTAGAIASAAALIKVGAAGIVSALAELVGAAAAPWVAIAIPAVSVLLLIIGAILLFSKASNQEEGWEKKETDQNDQQNQLNNSSENE